MTIARACRRLAGRWWTAQHPPRRTGTRPPLPFAHRPTGAVTLSRMPQSKGRRKAKTVRRPTPPKTASGGKRAKQSPKIYVAIMFGLMVLGVLMVVTRYILDTPSWVLLAGLGAMGAGFLMTTNYH